MPMTNPKLEDMWKEIKALNDEDLSALALLNQEEHQARQRPEIQVHFQGISGELIESRKFKASTSTMDLKLAILPTLQLRGAGMAISLQSFDLICQERILKPSDLLASLGDGNQIIQVVMRRDPIRLTQKLKWPNIWRARRKSDPPLSPEFFVIKSSHNVVINDEKLFQTEDSQLWREIQPAGSLWQAILTSELSTRPAGSTLTLVNSVNSVNSALDVSLFADMMDTERIYLMIEEDGIWDALQPWSNTRPWSDTSPEPLDVLVASVTETKEVLPLVARFRQYLHENSRVLLATTAVRVEFPEVFFNECVKELRSAGLKPLEMLTLEPHFSGSAVIEAENEKRPAGSM